MRRMARWGRGVGVDWDTWDDTLLVVTVSIVWGFGLAAMEYLCLVAGWLDVSQRRLVVRCRDLSFLMVVSVER